MNNPPRRGTVISALMWAREELKSAGIESSRLDAEILLSEVLGLERLGIYLNFDRPIGREEKLRFLSFIKRRRQREPLAYIINRKEFMSLELFVDKNVLIPRPETECMVEWIISNIPLSENSRVMDVGTGSGCIAASLLKYTPILHIFASDIELSALRVAEKNLEPLKMEKSYTLFNTSLFDDIEIRDLDLIVSNPPYIRSGDIPHLMPEISQHEPRVALDGGEGGDDIIYKLIADAHLHLREGGILIFEHREDFILDKTVIERHYHLLYTGCDYSRKNRFTALKRL